VVFTNCFSILFETRYCFIKIKQTSSTNQSPSDETNDDGSNNEVYRYAAFVKKGKAVSDTVVRATITRIMRRYLELPMTFSAYRHVAIAFARTLQHRDNLDDWAFLFDSQAGHSTDIADIHYAVSVDQVAGLGTDAVTRFRLAANLWHTFLGISSTATNNSQNATYNPTTAQPANQATTEAISSSTNHQLFKESVQTKDRLSTVANGINKLMQENEFLFDLARNSQMVKTHLKSKYPKDF
jgi:hypothetical protein